METYVLYLAYKDPRVPWYAKIFVACLVGYAFSPIDFIPDPIPVLGYVDDLVLIPLGIVLSLKMIPHDVLVECREEAAEARGRGKQTNRIAGGIIILIWIFFGALAISFVMRAISSL